MDGDKQCSGGWGGIRTPGGREPTPVFKTGALNHSATHPWLNFNYLPKPLSGTNRELAPNCPGRIGSPILARHSRFHDCRRCPVVRCKQMRVDLEGNVGRSYAPSAG